MQILQAQLLKLKFWKIQLFCTDGWKIYAGFILNRYKHYKVHHLKNESAREKAHVNGIESLFYSLAKGKLAKLNSLY